MALAAIAGVLVFLLLFVFLVTSFGHRIAHSLNCKAASAAESLLISIAIGVILWEVLIFFAEVSQHIRAGIAASAAVVLVFSIGEFRNVWRKVTAVWEQLCRASKFAKVLEIAIGAIALVEFVAAMAPLTGSDALHYHFAAPLKTLRDGFHPDFFLSHSFFCGQSHLLILMGLALGSEQIAMGLVFVAVILSAAAAACLTMRWTSGFWAGIVALIFLLTPVVFWQASSAGAPDLWMTFFTTVGVLAICQPTIMLRPRGMWGYGIIAGMLAGAVAGTKYTGCLMAFALAIAFVRESRSAAQFMAFLGASLFAGVWPYLRNFIWTGDPVFPFLMSRLHPDRVNGYALATYLADTGAGASHTLWQFIRFPLFAWIDPQRVGFWQFYGPLMLAFLPILALAIRRAGVRDRKAWRVALLVWLVSAVALNLTSNMTRFLLPLFPGAIAILISSVASLNERKWKSVRVVAMASVALYVLMGFTGLLAYDTGALAAATGLVSKENYLSAKAPDYQAAQFVNASLGDLPRSQHVLVFIRHAYFLNVPYLYGDPPASWAVDPSKLQTPAEWRRLFHLNHIFWVVRNGNYPPALATSLEQLQRTGLLEEVKEANVKNFQGNRMLGVRAPERVIIFRVNTAKTD